MASLNWDKLQQVTDGAITTIASAARTTSIDDNGFTALANFGISLTGSMSAGFTIGFIKG